jgi:IclR family acetate operon transcriptional repressor
MHSQRSVAGPAFARLSRPLRDGRVRSNEFRMVKIRRRDSKKPVDSGARFGLSWAQPEGWTVEHAVVVSELAREPRKRPQPASDVGPVQSVDRALHLLDLLAEAGGEATLTALAEAAGLHASTCHRLLSALVRRGYVTQVRSNGAYTIGAQVLHLTQICLRQVDLPRRAQPHLERVNRVTGETVHLAAMQGDSLITVAKRDALHAVRVDTGALGKSDAAHATAHGKAILAWLTEDAIRRIVTARKMRRFTANTITTLPDLIEELRLVRRNGYALDREEFQPGVICVGAPIRDYPGAVIGSISASTPTMRAAEAHLDLIKREVVAAARALSLELGEEPGRAAAEKAPARAAARNGRAKSHSNGRGGK